MENVRSILICLKVAYFCKHQFLEWIRNYSAICPCSHHAL